MEEIKFMIERLGQNMKDGQEKIENKTSELKSDIAGINSEITFLKSDQLAVREEIKFSTAKIQESEKRIDHLSTELRDLVVANQVTESRLCEVEAILGDKLLKEPGKMFTKAVDELSRTFETGFGNIICF